MRLDFVEFAGFRSSREKLRVDFGSGFTVITGRNGVGKSTVIDAIDFALTGSINKYRVEKAKGGGLAEHIWWVGEGLADQHFVRLGVIDDAGARFDVTRYKDGSLEDGFPLEDLLINQTNGQPITLRKLSDTTILRDELISELSLDLTEQARFAAVLEAIAPMTGPDLSKKVSDVAELAKVRTAEAERQLSSMQVRLAQTLEELAEARNKAEQAPNAEAALATLRSYISDLPPDVENRLQRSTAALAQLRLATTIVSDLRPRFQWLADELATIEAENISETIQSLGEEVSRKATAIEELEAEEKSRVERLEKAEAENKELAHLALLVEHGEAYGLEHGHCPLCAAARSDSEFRAAIEATKQRLAEAGSKVSEASLAVSDTRERLKSIRQEHALTLERRMAFTERIEAVERERVRLLETLGQHGYSADRIDLSSIDQWLFATHEQQVRIQEALVALNTADYTDRVGSLEKQAADLREQIDSLSGQISAREVVSDLAQKVDKITRAFPNEILAEQFDAVMPLLKEFYRRLRPHTDWDEIEYDFGGRIRASLNFYVADGRNPQFLFSSGQRRATGLAFLLAVHLARHWSELRTLVLDDPVQHIDDYRALNLVEVLAAIRRTGHQVIVAVEDAALASLLTRRLRSSQEQTGTFFELGTSASGSTCIKQSLALTPLPLTALQETRAS